MFIRMKVSDDNRKLAKRLAQAEAVSERYFNNVAGILTVRAKQSFLKEWSPIVQSQLHFLGANKGNEKWFDFRCNAATLAAFKETVEREVNAYEEEVDRDVFDNSREDTDD
jgi:hypothetical protein